ncbi:precorrin-6A synthase (deacetylating) [Sagittula salina]|uniref:Precorrin-6A synthase [deacetylating] n=1 Tax=Sagittula salina TaxID=2820268 RepID=A0A940MNT9_9RHOB|nr:precorrin-6A synthase (deacetylating) [Sagittula salina]MBP0484901.1 precorrin-6A synthase (deacetylating) [Sagittula salina]
MIETVTLVGIGTGNPGHLTLDGQAALQGASTILVPRKGAGKDDLAEIRLALLDRLGVAARVAFFDYPARDENLPYLERVERWHDAIAGRWAEAAGEARDVALLVWGDPGFYDSTMRIAARLTQPDRIRVLPGITAVQALTAAHAIPLNTVNGRILTTTGRRLREDGWPEGAETVVTVLDGDCSFTALRGHGLTIWWGAFLGMPEQILDYGPLDEVADRISATRVAAREKHGWVMDTYLLRKAP